MIFFQSTSVMECKLLLEPIVLEPVKKNIENSMVEGLKILIKSLILQMITTD